MEAKPLIAAIFFFWSKEMFCSYAGIRILWLICFKDQTKIDQLDQHLITGFKNNNIARLDIAMQITFGVQAGKYFQQLVEYRPDLLRLRSIFRMMEQGDAIQLLQYDEILKA